MTLRQTIELVVSFKGIPKRFIPTFPTAHQQAYPATRFMDPCYLQGRGRGAPSSMSLVVPQKGNMASLPLKTPSSGEVNLLQT